MNKEQISNNTSEVNRILVISLFLIIILLTFFKCDDILIIDTDDSWTLLSDSTSKYSLSVKVTRNLLFLEHVYSWESLQASDIVIGTKRYSGDIYLSENLGEDYDLVFSSDTVKWTRCFTTESKRHILWEELDSTIWLFTPEWDVIKSIKTGGYSWLGNWSIGESKGVIIYAEYGGNVDHFSVWRSEDDGESWQKVFTKKARGSSESEIRHFHVVQPDPYYPGTWYLSSGDAPYECMIWKSEDDGLTWKDVTDPNPNGAKTQDVHRFTAMYFDENYLYWGTDDELDGNAVFVRAERTEPLNVEVIDNLENLVRALVNTPYGLIFISEQKEYRDRKLVDLTIHISPDYKNAIELYRLSDPTGVRTGLCFSRASIASRGNIFFSYFDGSKIIKGPPGIMKWKIEVR
jgi:hypothetical protein